MLPTREIRCVLNDKTPGPAGGLRGYNNIQAALALVVHMWYMDKGAEFSENGKG